MSVATQITRLQGVRDQIRTKMVGLGLSSNTDLLQDLANDLDGVSKISPTNNDTTDPGTGYTNVDTLSRSTSTRYIKVPKGYNDTNRKFTVSGVANGAYSASVASHTTTNASASSSVTGSITNVASTTKPAGTDGTNYYTITPKLTTAAGSSKATGKATIDTAGYLAVGNTTSGESSVDVGVTASQGDSYYLKASSVTKEDPGTSYANKATVTPSTSAQYVKVTAGYLPNSKITVNAIPSPYYNTSGVTATAGTVLKDYKFVNSSGTTVTGTIATATSSNVSGFVSGDNPGKITLTAAKTSGSSSTTATASATVTKGLYTGSSNIKADLTPQTITATAEATLAGTNGAIELTAGTSAFTKTSTADYSNGFITSVKVNPTPSETKEYTPTMKGDTVYPDDTGKLLSSVTVKGVPCFRVTLSSSSWKSDSNVTIGKYYYNVSGDIITASNNLYVMPDSASTSQSFGVYAYSQSKASGASTGTLQFRAMIQPTSDLTYTVYYLS